MKQSEAEGGVKQSEAEGEAVGVCDMVSLLSLVKQWESHLELK